MSIDWLHDLERGIENGKEVFACASMGKNQWLIGKALEETTTHAQRTANYKKLPVNVVRLVSKHDAIAGDLFLVPVSIEEPGSRGEPQIQWSTVETREAAEMMIDVRHGPAPFFAMQLIKTENPAT